MQPEQRKSAVTEAARAECAAQAHPQLRLYRGFASRYLHGERDLIVYVPPGYDQHPGHRYPVLYMHDGQNLFDEKTSFVPGQTWQMGEQTDAAIAAGQVEPLTIVGIYNAGERRLAEYTPDPDPDLGGGEADAYGQMLTHELMPWVETHYRVRNEREATGLGGSSLGGLVSLYLGLQHAQRFGRLAVLSPSVWWNRKSILDRVRERAPQLSERPRIWLDVGSREGVRTLRDAAELNRQLLAHGWVCGETLHFARVRGGAHEEASWARRVRPMLQFLFPA